MGATLLSEVQCSSDLNNPFSHALQQSRLAPPRTKTKQQTTLPSPAVIIQCFEEFGLLPAHVLVL